MQEKLIIFYTLLQTLLNLRNLKRNGMKNLLLKGFHKTKHYFHYIDLMSSQAICIQNVFLFIIELKIIGQASEDTSFGEKKLFSLNVFQFAQCGSKLCFRETKYWPLYISLLSFSFQNKCLSVSAPRKQFW